MAPLFGLGVSLVVNGHLAVAPYRPLSEVVYSKLREAICEGMFRPGERLVQAELARELGVSRIPVREALHRLSEEGLVESRPRKGAMVRRPSVSELRESWAAARILVTVAMEHVVDRITDAQIATLERLHFAMRKQAAQARSSSLAVTNQRFHRFIFKCGGLGKLHDCMDVLMACYPQGVRIALATRGHQAMAEHEEILAALRAHDRGRLVAAAEKHTTNYARAILSLVTGGAVADDCAAL